MYLLCWIAADESHWVYCSDAAAAEPCIRELLADGVLAENIQIGELMAWELHDELHSTPVVEDSMPPGSAAVDPTRGPDLDTAG